jgi:predicted nucleotidyltransferase
MIKFSKIELNKTAKNYQLADIYFFGSQISGFKREDSDLDIGVRFKNGLPKENERGKIYGNIFSDLNLCFKNQKIDLVFIEEVPLHFQFKIINEGVLMYSENFKNSANFQEKTANYYCDYKYFIDEYFKGVLESAVK